MPNGRKFAQNHGRKVESNGLLPAVMAPLLVGALLAYRIMGTEKPYTESSGIENLAKFAAGACLLTACAILVYNAFENRGRDKAEGGRGV